MSNLDLGQSIDIAAFLRLIHGERNLFEVRSLVGSVGVTPYSGYFIDPEVAAAAIAQFETTVSPNAIYCTINPVDPNTRRATNRIERAKRGKQTSAREMVARKHLFIDIDVVKSAKPAGTGATDEQVSWAIDFGNQIEADLTAIGWPAPLRMMSGNGSYLIYEIDEPNNDESSALIRNILYSLTHRYEGHPLAVNRVEIDTATHDAPRICKVAGTIARKGDGIGDRPHRMAWFNTIDSLDTVPSQLLLDLASHCPEAKRKSKSNSRKAIASSMSEARETVLEVNDVVVQDLIADAKKHLRKLSPSRADDREEWLQVGMALHYCHPSLLHEWIAFSKKSSKFVVGECEELWSDFDRAKGITDGTLAYFANFDDHRHKMQKFRDNWLKDLDIESPADREFMVERCRTKNEEAGTKIRMSDHELAALVMFHRSSDCGNKN